MAKAIAFFSGCDSYARPVHVAFREDGVAFYSISERTQWGVRMSKWRRWTGNDQPSLSEGIRRGFIEWGFKTLYGAAYDNLRLRLPEEVPA